MRGFGLKFRLFGFPVIIDFSFLLLVGLLWFTNRENPIYGLIIASCILVSVMVHEFGHAVVGRIFGLKPSIRMTFLGGLTEWTPGKKESPSNLQHILITLAGPFAGFALGGLVLAYCIVMDVPYSFTVSPGSVVDILLLFNFMWGLANLLPLYPLDGGQVLYYSLLSNKKLPAEKISAYVSLGLGGAVVAWALYDGRLFIAVIVVWLLSINFDRLRRAGAAPKREEVMDHARKITSHFNARRYREGLQEASELLRSTKEERARSWATEMAAVFLDLQDDPAATEEFYQQNKSYLSSSDALRFLRLKADGDIKEAMAFANRALYARPTLTLLAVYCTQLCKEGNFRQAVDLVSEHHESSWAGQLASYVQLQMLRHGAFRESVQMGEIAIQSDASPEIAYNIGAAYAQLENVAEALRWLEDAVRRGFIDAETMASDEDLRSLRDHHGFVDLLEQVRRLAAEKISDEQGPMPEAVEKD